MRFRILALVVLAPSLWHCKSDGFVNSQLSIASVDDALKITVSYMGDKKCRTYLRGQGAEEEIGSVLTRNKGSSSHLLDDANGELASLEFRVHSGELKARFFGDKFFGKSAHSQLTMEEIEQNCRRLILSVDSTVPPTITFDIGSSIANQKEKFEREFDFGTPDCSSSTHFCTFPQIVEGQRYFVYIEPSSMESKFSATVTYNWEGNKTHTITIDNIVRDSDLLQEDQQQTTYTAQHPTNGETEWLCADQPQNSVSKELNLRITNIGIINTFRMDVPRGWGKHARWQQPSYTGTSHLYKATNCNQEMIIDNRVKQLVKDRSFLCKYGPNGLYITYDRDRGRGASVSCDTKTVIFVSSTGSNGAILHVIGLDSDSSGNAYAFSRDDFRGGYVLSATPVAFTYSSP